MNISELITPTSLRDYAKIKGWLLVKEAAKDRLYVMTNPQFERRQLVFPMDTTAPDYVEAVSLIIEKLASFERRTLQDLIKSMLEIGDDAISFRVTSARLGDGSIPLSFAGAMVTGAQQLLLASACTVLKPKAHHPRLSRAEAQQFLETTRFRHTQPGSFVLNVSCPVQAMEVQPSVLPGDLDYPFVRQATLTLRNSLSQLITAIESDSLDELVNDTKNSESPLISSNFCEALSRFEDDSLKNAVDIGVTWAASIPLPENESGVPFIRIQHDYFSKIEEVRRELRSSEKHTEDTFIGTVERLDGDMDGDGRRSGEVILSLLLPEGEQVKARTNLNAEDYEKANRAHMKEGAYVMVTGRLQPGRQPRQLTNPQTFDSVPTNTSI